MAHQVKHRNQGRIGVTETPHLPARLVRFGWMLSHPLVTLTTQRDQVRRIVCVGSAPALAVMDLQPQPVR